MTKALALLLLYLAVVMLYGATTVHGRARLPILEGRSRAALARVSALCAIALSAWLWRGVESGLAAILVVLVALMTLGTTVTLLGPVAHRGVWGAAVLASVAIPLLMLTGGAW